MNLQTISMNTLTFLSMKFLTRLTLILFSFGLGILLMPSAVAAKQLYTCGMHPQIIREEPGDCPICGMKLQPVRANSAGATAGKASSERKIKYYKSSMIAGQVSEKPGKDTMGMDMVPVYDDADTQSNSVQIDAGTIQRMNLKTALVTTGPVRREFRTVGTIAYNEEGLRDITTKYDGWIEKLFVNTTWAEVKAGDPLFEIYSPDLYNAQLNYLVAVRSEGTEGGPLTRAAKARLQLFDLSDDFVSELARSGEAHRTYVFRAPASGVVIEKMALVGQMMKPGERIYRMADLSTVWALAQIYESDLPYVNLGQSVTVRTSYGLERSFQGKIALLLPQVDEQTRTVMARIVINNADGFLRPGMFTDVKLSAQLSDSAVLVPEMAVLRSGEKNTVFVALEGGNFDPREVKLGNRSEGGNYEVLSGLVAGDRIVTSGQFMLDSESQLREAIQKMLKGDTATAPATDEHAEHADPVMKPGDEHAGHAGMSMPSKDRSAHSAHASMAAEPDQHAGHQNASAEAVVQLYTCPMEEHADVVTDHPGKCPKCGMKLVPTSEVEHGKKVEALWHKQHPAAKIQ